MTTFSSQDFQQVYGNFPSTTAAAPASSYNTTWIKPVSGFYGDADVFANTSVNPNLTLGSVTFGPKPSFEWPIIEPNTVPYEPIVTLSPAQQQQIDAAKQKLLKNLKKSDSAIKYDLGKADWSLMPWEAVEEINKVLEFGANKYNEKDKKGPNSWNWAKGTGLGRLRVLNAVFRHLFAYARGEKLDPESGLSHLNHAACGLLFMIYYNLHSSKYPEIDGK
jgi:hypothetical protein